MRHLGNGSRDAARKGHTGQELFLEKETYTEFRDATEKEFFLLKLKTYGYNVSKTARKLGMQRSNLYKKLEKYGISYKRPRDEGEQND